MSLTRVNINTAYNFTQPEVDGTVVVRIDSGVRWIEKETMLFVSKGGVYRVVEIIGFYHTLKLIDPVVEPTEIVDLSFVWPIAQYFEEGEIIPSASVVQEILEERASETLIPSEKALVEWALGNYANRLAIKSPAVGETEW